MKRLCFSKNNTKSGVASLYVVLFSSLLFGVITLSFTQIILSESEQSSEDDLSQSAYDAAMAGVEDAKRAVNDYYKCLTSGTCSSNIQSLFSNADMADCNNGFPLGQILYNTDEEIKIQAGGNGTTETYQDQAYTCVLIRDTVPDYRGTLTSDTRTKVIPLGLNRDDVKSNFNNVQRIRFSWHSQLNLGTSGENAMKFSGSGKLPAYANRTLPPTIQLTLIKTPDTTLSLDAMHREDNENNVVNSTMVLLPSGPKTDASTEVAGRVIEWGEVLDAGNASFDAKRHDYNDEHYNDSAEYSNQPFEVKCTTKEEFACTVDIKVGGELTNGDNLMLVASIPYADAYTDFAASLIDGNGNSVPLKGVQVSVDSTGRTNQLYRRVEVRLDPADLYFPYPQYALEITGRNGADDIEKNFWVTANCWATNPVTGGGGANGSRCDNNKEVESSGSWFLAP